MKTSNYKPLQHIAAEKGWINDPNGLVFYRGYYHVFFQYYPNDTKWGPMHWGHAITKDFKDIEYLEPALYPDEAGMCFSGSAIVKDDVLYLLYTVCRHTEEGDVQEQAIASSVDGRSFKKEGVVIASDDLDLTKYSKFDFRDPCVWKHEGRFYLMAGVKKLASTSNILMFESRDLFHWTMLGEVLPSDISGGMVECPDYHEELGLLMFSEQFSKPEGDKHLNEHTNRYIIGKLSYETGRIAVEREDIIDYGFDFYAAQSVKPQGIMLAWMDMWDRDNPSAAYGFAGMLTCPRKLSIQNGRLSQAPIVHGEVTETLVNQPEIKTTMFIGSFEWELHHATSFKILLNKGDAHCTSVEGKDGNVIFDRSRSGVTITGKEEDEYSKKGQRVMPLSEKEDHKLVVVIDKYSVELFLDGQAMTNAAYHLDGDDALELYTDAEESVFRKRVLPS